MRDVGEMCVSFDLRPVDQQENILHDTYLPILLVERQAIVSFFVIGRIANFFIGSVEPALLLSMILGKPFAAKAASASTTVTPAFVSLFAIPTKVVVANFSGRGISRRIG